MKTAVCCNQSCFDHGHVCFGFGHTASIRTPTTPPTPASSADPVTERILKALSGVHQPQMELAETVVPHSGKADSLNGVFFKSTSSDEDKCNSNQAAGQVIVKSAPCDDAELTAAASLATFSAPAAFATAIKRVDAPQLKAPTVIRKFQFHGFFSLFYNSHQHLQESIEEEAEEEGREDCAMDCDPPAVASPSEEWKTFLNRQPTKSILKPHKQVGDLSHLLEPVQKSVFLRQEEVLRLTKFTHNIRSRHLSHSRESVSPTEHEIQQQPHLPHGPHAFVGLAVHKAGASSMPQLGNGHRRRLQFTLERSTVHETWHKAEYERGGVESIAKALTPEIATQIKRELNEVKREMEIHEESRQYTQFYPVRS